jgi:L-seryl-tRNA(Ser) seleniumtransferase
MVMGAAAIMAGTDRDRIARLPDTAGLKNEFLIQKPTRYHYDRAVTVPGGILVEVGGEGGTTAAQMEAAIGPRTAAVLYAARSEGDAGVLPLADVVRIARRRGVAVLVDAAAEIYPLDRMTWLAGRSGADLVCFGAKYFGSANSTGLICGRRSMIDAVTAQGFIAFEVADTHTVGRGYKVDRQEIVGTLVALREWFAADHEARLAAQERRVRTIVDGLAGLAGVTAERLWPRRGAWLQVRVTLDEGRVGKSVAAVHRALRAGDPSIRVRLEGGQLVIAVNNLEDGEDRLVAERLRQELA